MNWLRAFFMILFGLVLIVMIITKPLNRISLEERGILAKGIDSVGLANVYQWQDSLPFRISYGRVNITPNQPMPMAGYAQREAFQNVHDSLYCRLILIEMGDLDLYLISADLLIFPDKLRDSLILKTHADTNTKLYISATHTHNGLGGWADGLGGELIAGEFHPQWLQKVSHELWKEMASMRNRTIPASLFYFETDASEFVKNRLVEGAPVDGLIRGIKFYRQTGDSAVLFTYSGHPTLLDRKSLDLSNDYPGATIKKLEAAGYNYAMFMAGMVGSHRITNVQGTGYERINSLAEILSDRIKSANKSPINSDYVKNVSFGVPFGPSQVRLTGNLAVRNWVFSALLQPLEGTISAFNLGGLNMVSTPGDFSGELYKQINDPFKPAIITSFNGDYIGYITRDEHYDESDYMEVRSMNWVGPYYGDYFCTMINRALQKTNSTE